MANQRFNLQAASAPHRGSPEALLDFHLSRYTHAPLSAGDAPRRCSTTCARAARGPAQDAQLANKASGLGRLIVGSAEYQFN